MADIGDDGRCKAASSAIFIFNALNESERSADDDCMRVYELGCTGAPLPWTDVSDAPQFLAVMRGNVPSRIGAASSNVARKRRARKTLPSFYRRKASLSWREH